MLNTDDTLNTGHIMLRTFILAALFVIAHTASAAPAVGDPAPDFALHASDGNVHKLSDYRGKQPVVIAFFPKAFTGG